jgi:hypothetical protein
MAYTIHVDMSGKPFKKENIGIAWIAVEDLHQHKGAAISSRLIKELMRDLQIDYDAPRFHAICIYLITKEDIQNFKEIIICNDEPYEYVRPYLELLFERDNISLEDHNPISLLYYREKIGKNISSLAHGRANSYRKRGFCEQNRSRGIELNVVKINYAMIKELWRYIDSNFHEKRSGEL